MRSRDDEAFADAEQRAAKQQNDHRHRRSVGKAQREEIEEPSRGCDHQPGYDGVLGAARVRIPACPNPRQDCSPKLAACHKPDQKRPEAKTLMDVQWQHRYCQADDNAGLEVAFLWRIWTTPGDRGSAGGVPYRRLG